MEALTAGSPVLHITSQIDTPFMDRDRAAIHDVPRQPDMLKAVSQGRLPHLGGARRHTDAAGRLSGGAVGPQRPGEP